MTIPTGVSSLAADAAALTHTVGRYRLIAGIGRGGMADVYLAVYDSADAGRFQKLLVLKLLKPELSQEPEFVEMFLDEARLAARLSHPNVVQTLEVGEDAGRYFLAMEYLEGQPLNRVLQTLASSPGFDVSARVTILLRALGGLDYAHELVDYDGTPLSVVHRDVSPGNILVGYDGQIKLMDFGIAKARDSSTETRVGMFKGKTAYMAPEQARAGLVDRRADIYSAGVVLWELLVGRRMWQGLTQVEILSRVMAGDIVPPSHLAPGLAPELERICLKALALHRGDRYGTAAEFAAALESFVAKQLVPKTDREVGRLVGDAFARDRARIREIIEQQLSPRSRPNEALPQMPTLQDQQSLSLLDGTAPYSVGPSSLGAPSSQTSPSRSGPVEPPFARSFGGAGVRLRRRLIIGAPLLVAAAVATVFALRSPTKTMESAAAPTEKGAPAAAVSATSSQAGVSAGEVTLGMSAVFSGPNRQLGENMKLGLETAFWAANNQGGVHGRKLRLVALDDGYEASRVSGTMQELLDGRKVFAVVGNVGTPTSVVAAPLASQHKTIFFGAFTGAPVLRQDPPDRYVFNYRASYREETAASLKYLVEVQKIPIEQIVVFAQEDSFGDAGYEGVSKAVRQLNHGGKDVLRVGYKRNTTDVEGAVAQILKYHDRTETVRQSAASNDTQRVMKHPVRAVVMVATYRAAAKFIQKMREVPRLGKPLFVNVSFVGTEALADDLKAISPTLCPGVYVTQVVPPFNSGATGVRRYREALSGYQPQAQPGFVSLEGFIVGSVFVDALQRAGAELTTEKLVDTLEQINGVDLGFGTKLAFSLSEHQGSHKVWGTRLDETCSCQTADLE
jgi:branched-chain amino acid transport system substrate-binding protein